MFARENLNYSACSVSFVTIELSCLEPLSGDFLVFRTLLEYWAELLSCRLQRSSSGVANLYPLKNLLRNSIWVSLRYIVKCEILRFWYIQTHRFWDAELLRLWDTETLRNWEIEKLRLNCWNAEMLRYWDAKILRYWNAEMLIYLYPEILRS